MAPKVSVSVLVAGKIPLRCLAHSISLVSAIAPLLADLMSAYTLLLLYLSIMYLYDNHRDPIPRHWVTCTICPTWQRSWQAVSQVLDVVVNFNRSLSTAMFYEYDFVVLFVCAVGDLVRHSVDVVVFTHVVVVACKSLLPCKRYLARALCNISASYHFSSRCLPSREICSSVCIVCEFPIARTLR